MKKAPGEYFCDFLFSFGKIGGGHPIEPLLHFLKELWTNVQSPVQKKNPRINQVVHFSLEKKYNSAIKRAAFREFKKIESDQSINQSITILHYKLYTELKKCISTFSVQLSVDLFK
jgi:hypothetical protein